MEHQESKAARIRASMYFQNVLGMKCTVLANFGLQNVHNIRGKPYPGKSQGPAKWMNQTKCLTSNDESFFRVYVRFHAVSDILMFVNLSELSPVMTTVLTRGIQQNYDTDNVTKVSSADFPKFFPCLSNSNSNSFIGVNI